MKTSQAFRQEIIELRVPPDRLAFWWLGQQSWIIKTANHILGLDLYLKEDPRRIVPPLPKPEDCDFFGSIFATHDHTDHFDQSSLARIAPLNERTRFFIPKHLREKASDLGIDAPRLVLMDGENAFEDGTLHVCSIPSAHERLEYDAETGFQYIGYVIMVDGFTVYHAGDTCYYDGLLGRLKECSLDLMFVPINGRDGVRYRRNTIGNLTYQEAADLVGMAEPKLGCPAHYAMFAHNTEDPRLFADYLTAKYPGQKYWIGKPFEPVWMGR